MTSQTKKASAGTPVVYALTLGKLANQVEQKVTWSGGGVLPDGYTLFVSYQLPTGTYVVGYNAKTAKADTYLVATDGSGLRPQSTTILVAGYSWLTLGSLNSEQYVMGYSPSTGAFDFYLIGSDLSLMQVYSFKGPSGLTTASLFGYRGALYFVGYNMANGAVAYYQVTSTSPQALSAQQIWSDTWAQGWTRFTFFQMAMENFFFKTNTKYINCNIDHIMDNPSTGSHPVGTKLPLSQDLDIVQAFYLAGDAYFATHQNTGAMTLNRFLASGQGWVQGASFSGNPQAITITPLYVGAKTFLLVY